MQIEDIVRLHTSQNHPIPVEHREIQHQHQVIDLWHIWLNNQIVLVLFKTGPGQIFI